MNSSSKRARTLVSAFVATVALLSLSAAAASAAPVPARWVNPGTIFGNGSLTLKQNGTNEKVCTLKSNTGEAVNFGTEGAMWLETPFVGPTEYSCTGGSLYLNVLGSTKFETVYFLSVEGGGSSLASPYGTYTPSAYNATWTNASGGVSSKLNFSNTKIGSNAGGNITATGSITVKRGSGADITLTH
jgi:hypothetical protein